MAGGYTQQEISGESQEVARFAKPIAEEKAGKTFTVFEPVQHSTQVVAGINHKLKIKVGDDEYIHVVVYEHFSGQRTVQSVATGKTLQDTL